MDKIIPQNLSSYFLLAHSFSFSVFGLSIFLKQKEIINFTFGRKGKELGKIDKSVEKVLSKSFAASILVFSLHGLYLVWRDKKEYVRNMLYTLIIYHLIPIYLTIRSNEFRESLPDLYKFNSITIISILLTLYFDFKLYT